MCQIRLLLWLESFTSTFNALNLKLCSLLCFNTLFSIMSSCTYLNMLTVSSVYVTPWFSSKQVQGVSIPHTYACTHIHIYICTMHNSCSSPVFPSLESVANACKTFPSVHVAASDWGIKAACHLSGTLKQSQAQRVIFYIHVQKSVQLSALQAKIALWTWGLLPELLRLILN